MAALCRLMLPSSLCAEWDSGLAKLCSSVEQRAVADGRLLTPKLAAGLERSPLGFRACPGEPCQHPSPARHPQRVTTSRSTQFSSLSSPSLP